ncbi:hypothetical protein QFZ43_001031 [Streptomyces afghaniensis]|nr:hypothetical protein [Streptomyces afghaniensis]
MSASTSGVWVTTTPRSVAARHVDAVVAHRREGDDPQVRLRRVEQRGVDAVAAEDEQTIAALDRSGQLVG